MKLHSLFLLSLTAFLFLAGQALAHKVSVFAFVDGGEIQVECRFSRSQKVKNGKLVITDIESSDVILEGVTDEQGLFRFRPPEDFLATGHGLNIRLFAGEGHQDDWKITPEELRALSGTGLVETSSDSPAPDMAKQQERLETPSGSGAPSTINATEIEAIVSKVLDAKLAPINQTLARQQNDEPRWRDIIGGIGWIIGLLGLAAYMKYRR